MNGKGKKNTWETRFMFGFCFCFAAALVIIAGPIILACEFWNTGEQRDHLKGSSNQVFWIFNYSSPLLDYYDIEWISCICH